MFSIVIGSRVRVTVCLSRLYQNREPDKYDPNLGFCNELGHRDAGAVVGLFDADVVHEAFHEF